VRVTRARAAAALAATIVLACASPGYPPGGPPDSAPPQLTGISPDTNATNVTPDEVRFDFDEVVRERPATGTLEKMVLISPSDGEPRVRWRRDAITVKPRGGFRPNTAYTISILPGLSDLRGNTSRAGFRTTFATGATIPGTRLSGVVFDWPAGRVSSRAFVQAFPRGDTTLAWVAATDSAGRFELRDFPSGSYFVRAFLDANDNRALDPREAFDTVGVAVADSARIEILAFVHDTIGPRISTLTVDDSLTLRLEFDQPIDPNVGLRPGQLVLLAADSSAVPVVALPTDSALAAEREALARTRADSAARADSARRAAGADTTAPARAAAAAPRIPIPSRTRPAPADSARLVQPSRPVPPARFNVRLGRPLTPGASYRMRAQGVRGLLGVERTSERVFQVPRAAPRDSARAAPGPQRP
jgi:hypothetical protein